MIEAIGEAYNEILFVLFVLLLILIKLRNLVIKKIDKGYIDIETATAIGKEEYQEDYLEVVESSQGTLAVLADGFGKNGVGSIASAAAVKIFTKLFLEQQALEKVEYFFHRAFNTANNEILKRIDNNQGGTSIAGVIITDNLLYYGLVGNIVVAVHRKGELFKLSEGHTINVMAKKEFYKGKLTKEQALSALKEKKLLHYLGQEDFKDIEMLEIPIVLQKKDLIILMNKGIYDSLTWTQLEDIIHKNRIFKYLQNEIIEAVKHSEKGDKYNGSIILMRYLGE